MNQWGEVVSMTLGGLPELFHNSLWNTNHIYAMHIIAFVGDDLHNCPWSCCTARTVGGWAGLVNHSDGFGKLLLLFHETNVQ